ncbi:MAG: chemotaxis protein CheW [Methanomassiliicoccus sp.]|nr:chemotaxis protein CheW [Methanomassiliicoccus sp.]
MARKRGKVELTGDVEQIVSFRLGKETFAIVVSQVREIRKVEDITKVPKLPSYIEGVMNLRGQITTVIDLKKRLNIASEGPARSTQSRIIVAEVGDNQLGIIVDAVEDVMRVPKESISLPPKTLAGTESSALTGISKLPDKLIMMLDLEKVMNGVELIRSSQGDASLKAPADKMKTAEV